MLSFFSNVQEQLENYKEVFQKIEVAPFFHAIIYFLIGLAITLIVRWFVGKVSARKVSRHHSMLFKRLTFYIGLTFSFIFLFKALGINVTALLGAAGILTAAVAFAAQTSISNFLSGVFLVAEKPFELGDYIEVNNLQGEVLSIDLLSVKIRTRDNLLVRIPNESLLKSQFCNLTRFPIRRFDMKLRVAFDENLEKIKRILSEAAKTNTLCLVSPAPELIFNEFAENGVQLQFSVWAKQASFSDLQTTLQLDIQRNLTAQGIKLPVYPH